MDIINFEASYFSEENAAKIHELTKDNILIFKNYLSSQQALDYLCFVKNFAKNHEPDWHPLIDDCPDYHKVNDEYPGSYVRGKLRGCFFHSWNDKMDTAFSPFTETFRVKAKLLNQNWEDIMRNQAQDGFVSRIVVHQYPKGGGYLSEHIDPVNEFNALQTVITLTEKGKSYSEGGLYVRNKEGDVMMLDTHIDTGDMIIFNQQYAHGVAPVDADQKLDWSATDDGRWTVIPINVRSDLVKGKHGSPKELLKNDNKN